MVHDAQGLTLERLHLAHAASETELLALLSSLQQGEGSLFNLTLGNAHAPFLSENFRLTPFWERRLSPTQLPKVLMTMKGQGQLWLLLSPGTTMLSLSNVFSLQAPLEETAHVLVLTVCQLSTLLPRLCWLSLWLCTEGKG